jgi:Calcineurin-like phosphoesterase
MTADRFTWLHFTDLHVGMGDGQWLWPGVEEPVLADLARIHARLGRIDAVFFTGDLTQKGSTEEFSKFDETWVRIRRTLEQLGSNPTFLAVPGNHDLARPKPGMLLDALKQWKADADLRKRFWTEDDGGYREAVRSAFEAWSAWASHGIGWENLKDVQRNGLLPGDFAATIEIGNRAIGVLGLNTAALQLSAGDYQGRLSLHARQVSALVDRLYEWVDRHDACLVLSHHDTTWLDDEGRAAWNAEIAPPGRFVAHLCGHRHQQVDTLVTEGGAKPRRTVIGRSLFGLETYEHEGGRKERLHGYSAGVIQFAESRSLRLWPRRDEPQQAGHIEIGADRSVTLGDDDGTSPQDLGLPPRLPFGGSLDPHKLVDQPPPIPLEGWIEITDQFLQACRRDLDKDALRMFFDGQEPSWEHALAPEESIPRRDIVGKVVANLAAPTVATMALLVAAGGEGKSLVLRQAAVDLVAKGCRVLWRQDEGRVNAEAVTQLSSETTWILCTDDGEVIAAELAATLRKLREAGRQNVHWLIGARDTDWRARFPKSGEPAWSLWANVWPRVDEHSRRAALGLTRQDAAKVVAAWEAIGSLGKLEKVRKADRARVLFEAARQSDGTTHGTFFGAVLDGRFDADGLRAHLDTLLQRLGAEGSEVGKGSTLRHAFLYAAAAEAVGIDGVDLKVVAELLGVERKRRRPDILHRLGQEALAAGGGDALRTRAPAIARAAIQLVEAGRIDEDLTEVYRDLVRVTGKLGRNGDVDVSHGDIMNCGPRVFSGLKKLGIQPDRAKAIARVAADEAVRVEPDKLGWRVTQAETYLAADDARHGSQVLQDALVTPNVFSDWKMCVRGAIIELAVCEGRIPHLLTDLWLTGMSLADAGALGPVADNTAKRSLAGLGTACLEIEKNSPLEKSLSHLLRATAVLGPRVAPAQDAKASSYFRRSAEAADRLKVPACTDDEALDHIAAGVRHAGERVTDTALRSLVSSLVGSAPPTFEGLRRTLGLGVRLVRLRR